MKIIVKIIITFTFLLLPFYVYGQNYADMIIIEKSERVLKTLKEGKVIKTYSIALGFEPIGHKQNQGDGKTPEGLYYINKKLFNSDFHIALQISYPNKWDIRKAQILNISPGGSIMIHGQSNKINSTLDLDWTNGCIAVTNTEIEEISKFVRMQTPIYIKK